MGWAGAPDDLYWSSGGRTSDTGNDLSAAVVENAPIVVLFGWMSCERRHISTYTRLYHECGWDALAVRPGTLNLWLPGRALRLALQVLDTLLERTQGGLRPLVFAAFSGGAKACLYKLWQVLLDQCPEVDPEACQKYRPLQSCIVGQIYDSSPIDFVSKIGVRFLSHPPGGQQSTARFLAAKGTAIVLDGLFKGHFEADRRDFWQTLERAAVLQPLLLLYSRDDPLAPAERIDEFVANVRKVGADVTAVTWPQSLHVGHLRLHRDDYRTAVSEFLERARKRWLMLQSTPLAHTQTASKSETGLTFERSEQALEDTDTDNIEAVLHVQVASAPFIKQSSFERKGLPRPRL
ncbi:hypothetical protein KFL_002120100 [Klebsormidium nitens]|uniref:Transmembrane protein 53 n=1 Tax=Klebsormidium nitens TaxID=105231 RepID=A0A1Y1I8A3_KLENI|nr:hypothetical protein KFL_002120100 [Klebsormidium nitens]|eukprot:GAQ84916.1 hypothetical protein KFL_002120100 [Klebsormidium nitens]